MGQRKDVEMPQNGRDIIQAMAGIRIPLYRRKYDAQFKEAEIQGEVSKNRQTDMANGLLTEMEKAYRDLADGLRRIELYRKQIRIATQTLDVLIEEYSSAGNDFEELLRMDRNILDYSLKLERARVDQNLSVARLDYLLGL
ncbi:MAG: TolC family protein [Bacteroidia bacterium]